MSKAESNSDSNSPPGPSKKKTRAALSDADDASDHSDCDAVHGILGEDEQDGDSSDKLPREIEEESNKADKTGPNIWPILLKRDLLVSSRKQSLKKS